MEEDSNPGTYTVQAIHPDLEPVVETYPTATAADIRASQLFAAGYVVSVVYARAERT
jgi:hypothetical protein